MPCDPWHPSSRATTMRALFLTLLFVFTIQAPEAEAKTCSSIDIRNTVDQLESLRNCTIITGFLQIVLIENNAPEDFEKYSFPELKEITDYFLLFRVRKLTSLGKLFPNLAIIRGQNLFSNYALIIYEMDLTEVGLYSLVSILRGGVRIEKNFKLCYLSTINWNMITRGETTFNDINKGLCSDWRKCPEKCKNSCWNDKVCQKEPQAACPGDCLYGCRANDECEVCKNYIEDKKCVNKCSNNRYLMKQLSRCVSREECRALEGKWWVFGDECLNTCPPKYEAKNGTCVLCEKFCHKICNSTMVTNINSLEQLNGCTNITGYIIIRLDTDIQGDIEMELEKNLGNIEEISEYLKIVRSMAIRNFNFFKSLRTIKGQRLEQQRYSLIVHENQNLQKLWDLENFQIQIQNGTFSFHYNPKLCPSEIDRLASISRLQMNYTYVDVSNHSNGDSFACSQINIQVQVVNVTESSAFLQWKPPPSTKHTKDPVSRYLIYYKEVNDEDIFSEEICGIPTWMTEFVFNEKRTTYHTIFYYNLTDLQTFTNYSFFVRTDARLAGRSEIKYFLTLSNDPTEPVKVTAEPKSSNAIKLSWEKPLHINGILSHYVVVGFLQKEEKSFIDQRNYCKYKMIETAAASASIVETTTEAILPNDTCSCKKDTEDVTVIRNNDFDAICSDLDKITYNELKGLQSHDCANFKYLIPSHKDYEEFIVKREGPATMTPVENKVSELVEDGVYYIFEKHIPANQTTFVIEHLKHYTIYYLLLKACNENRTLEVQCSSVVMVFQRTGKKEDADDITDLIVKVSNTFDVEIEWSEPPNPNAVIVSYDIEYRNINKEKSHPIKDCVTRKQHADANYKYKLKNLPSGEYELFVRAISLAGPGNPSSHKTFFITTPSQSSPVVLTLVVAFVLIFLVVVAYLYWRFKVKKSLERRHLIANVNPDYAGYREDEWEIDRENIEMHQELGQGTFGHVFSGYLKHKNVPCAVKTVNEEATMHDRMEFLNEASVMKAFNEAHHVVRLIGVVSKGVQPLVVMELMARGDLKSFLRTTRDSSTSLTCLEMYRMAAEIADGMAYLSAKKFVHRDLAARNCMVSADRTVKIGDFGMTRDIYETDYYRKETRGLLPVRWMAPESLGDGVFTSDSDVWSYGIVLWEIATLAEQPYQGLANEQVLQFVISRGTLDRPPQCPDLLYDIMDACWKWNPSNRPLFTDIVEKLETHVGQDFRLVSFYHSRDGEDYRRNKSEINKARQNNYSAMNHGKLAAMWSRSEDAVQFNSTESPADTPASVSLLSCQHSPPNEYSPDPGTSYKRRL